MLSLGVLHQPEVDFMIAQNEASEARASVVVILVV